MRCETVRLGIVSRLSTDKQRILIGFDQTIKKLNYLCYSYVISSINLQRIS